jgi:hypothetical protein
VGAAADAAEIAVDAAGAAAAAEIAGRGTIDRG